MSASSATANKPHGYLLAMAAERKPVASHPHQLRHVGREFFR